MRAGRFIRQCPVGRHHHPRIPGDDPAGFRCTAIASSGLRWISGHSGRRRRSRHRTQTARIPRWQPSAGGDGAFSQASSCGWCRVGGQGRDDCAILRVSRRARLRCELGQFVGVHGCCRASWHCVHICRTDVVSDRSTDWRRTCGGLRGHQKRRSDTAERVGHHRVWSTIVHDHLDGRHPPQEQAVTVLGNVYGGMIGICIAVVPLSPGGVARAGPRLRLA